MSDELIPVEEVTTSRKRGRPAIPRTCGTCLFIRYTDSQVLTLKAGTCARSAESGRVGVQAAENGCDRWVRRSTDRRRTDKARQERVRSEVAAVNARVTGRRGR